MTQFTIRSREMFWVSPLTVRSMVEPQAEIDCEVFESGDCGTGAAARLPDRPTNDASNNIIFR